MVKGNGRATVTTAGTPVQISSTSKQYFSRIYVQALASNTMPIAVGFDNTVRAASATHVGVQLAASAGQLFEVSDARLQDFWIDSRVNGEGVAYTIWS